MPRLSEDVKFAYALNWLLHAAAHMLRVLQFLQNEGYEQFTSQHMSYFTHILCKIEDFIKMISYPIPASPGVFI